MRLALADIPEWLAVQGRRRWIIDRVMPVGLTILYGPTGVGKTGLAIHMAMAVAQGGVWAGRAVDAGAVAYVAGENFGGVVDRFHGVATLAGRHDLPITLMDRPSRPLASKGGAEQIVEALGDTRPGLIVIDTLATVFGDASQDDAAPASIFATEMEGLADRYGCAVVVIHHAGKRGGDMRGSQVLADRADAVLRVEARRGGPVLAVEKMRAAAATGAFGFQIGSEMLKIAGQETSIQIVANVSPVAGRSGDWAGPARIETAVETDKAGMLRVLEGLSGRVANGVTLVTRQEWRDAVYFGWPDKSPATRKATFSKHFKALKDEGKITVRGDKVTVAVTGNVAGNSEPKVTSSVAAPPLRGRADRLPGVTEEDIPQVPVPRRSRRAA